MKIFDWDVGAAYKEGKDKLENIVVNEATYAKNVIVNEATYAKNAIVNEATYTKNAVVNYIYPDSKSSQSGSGNTSWNSAWLPTQETRGNLLYHLYKDDSVVSDEKGNLFVRILGNDYYTTTAGTKGDWLLRKYGYEDHVVYSNNGVPYFRNSDGDWYISSLPIRPVISGEEYYAALVQQVRNDHPELDEEQQKVLVGETIWKNNYLDLRDQIAHCRTPEEREALIKAHTEELKKYEASGISVAKDIKDIRERQGMGSIALSNAEIYEQDILIIKEENPGFTNEQASAEYARRIQEWNDRFNNTLSDLKASRNLYELQQKINYYESHGVLNAFRQSNLDVDGKINEIITARNETIERDLNSIGVVGAVDPSHSMFADPEILLRNNTLNSDIKIEFSDGMFTDHTGTPSQIQLDIEEGYNKYFEGLEKLRNIPYYDFAMGYLHGLAGADGAYSDRSNAYKFGWNLSNNAMGELAGAAAKVIETAPPIIPGRGPALSSEFVEGATIARVAAKNIPNNIFFSSSKENDSSPSNFQESNKNDSVVVNLKYKKGWTKEQRAEADAKTEFLNNSNAVKTNPQRGGTSASSRYKKANGVDSVPKNSDVDHKLDLQLGGVDEVSNMWTLDNSVNRSLGKQINNQIKDFLNGTKIDKFNIDD
ncbi:hypothetical protein [Propionispora vibrioides]|uniref:Uncharacterized protein n=1 Tax=Propionispora vibrioides TaxID=112903 RepID=A0A1H8XA97_9FIRM|nr:hypothetical protein [Propionispora vibrioides]SEP36772.1 hypothetical protein SAMN04490178_12167 [Propionispora vibrioides]